MNKDVLDLAFEHGGDEYRRALEHFSDVKNSYLYTEYEGSLLRAFLYYIPLPVEYDVICVTDRYDEYTLSTWRELSKLLRNRIKEIKINSTTRHPTIQKAIKKYNGYRDGDTLVFTKD